MIYLTMNSVSHRFHVIDIDSPYVKMEEKWCSNTMEIPYLGHKIPNIIHCIGIECNQNSFNVVREKYQKHEILRIHGFFFLRSHFSSECECGKKGGEKEKRVLQ